jgi:hypothetical protein
MRLHHDNDNIPESDRLKGASAMEEYHITQFGPTDVWPNGGWSLYKITGDQIARMIVTDRGGQVVAPVFVARICRMLRNLSRSC